MASVVTANIFVAIKWTALDTTNVIAPKNINGQYPANGQPLAVNFAAGNTAGKIDALYVAQVTVPAGSTADLDLNTVVDPAGNTPNFTKVFGFMFYNNDLAGTKVTIGAGTHPLGPFFGTVTDTIDLYPGFPMMFGRIDATGVAVTNSSADTLHFANAGGIDILVDVLLFGRKT